MAVALSATMLKDSKSWPTWFDNLRQVADAHGIWEHINPDIEEDSAPPLLTRPAVPEDESGCQLFMAQNAAYEFQSRGLQAVTRYMLDTIDELYTVYMQGGKSVRERLCILKKMVAPPLKIQQEDAKDIYRSLANHPDTVMQSLATWTARFKRANYRCILLNMVGGSEEAGIKDFLRVAEEFEPDLASQFQSKLEITDSTTVDEVADKFLLESCTGKPAQNADADAENEDEDEDEDGT